MSLTLIDIVLVIVMIFFLIRGYREGIIKQIVTLVGLIVGLKIASDNYLFLSSFLEIHMHIYQPIANIFSFALLLFIVVGIASLIGWLIRGLTKIVLLSPIDRIVGAIVGLLKGGIIAYLVILLIAQIPYKAVNTQLNRSILAQDFLAITPYIQENLDKVIKP